MSVGELWYYESDGKAVGPFDKDSLSKMIEVGVITRDRMLIKEGSETWIPLEDFLGTNDGASTFERGKAAAILTGLGDRVSQASGLEKLDGFSSRSFFSQVFGKHTSQEIEEHFTAGTRDTTPELSRINTDWPTPWAFFRIFAVSILLSVVFYWALGRFNNLNLYPGYLFVGSFGLPLAVLVFFFEVNIPRNVSFYRVLYLLVMGGLFSLVLSLFLFELSDLHSWIGAMSAGFVEEVGKLLAVIFLVRHWKNYNWILNGMLFGAAVGVGFAAFETAGYVFRSFGAGEETMILRGLLAPFGHPIWTALAAGALWMVKGDRAFAWNMLKDAKFLRIFAFSVGLHVLWNSPISVPLLGGMTGDLAFSLVLGVVGWLIVLMLVQAGIKQVRQKQQATSS
jgi:RsiW-degrading membrane proteinase PrsW (M82 family)